MLGRLLSTTVLAGLALAAASCSQSHANDQAQPEKSGKAQQVAPSPRSNRPAVSAAADNRGRLLGEAVAALRETQNALTAIDQNKTNDAIAALERGTGKLEIVLARTPNLALAPVDVAVTTHDVLGSVDDVETLRKQAKEALDDGRVQEARQLIGDLVSETDVDVSNLPLATYPAALKQAAALLHQGKPKDAEAVLETALSTIVVERTIIPLPVARAQSAIEHANGLSEKANRTAADNDELRNLLATARTDLRFGQALGYATKQDMKDLLDAVDEIERKTSGQQHGKGLLDRIEGLFKKAHEASQPKGNK